MLLLDLYLSCKIQLIKTSESKIKLVLFVTNGTYCTYMFMHRHMGNIFWGGSGWGEPLSEKIVTVRCPNFYKTFENKPGS